MFFYGDVKNGFHKALGVFGDLQAPLFEELVVYKGCQCEDEDEEHSLHIFKCKVTLLKHLTICGTSLMFCQSPLSAILSLNHANSLDIHAISTYSDGELSTIIFLSLCTLTLTPSYDKLSDLLENTDTPVLESLTLHKV